MLDEVHIRGLSVIEDATLRLGPGLTVLTGETGVGKTMVVSALQLLVGARADTSLVRSGVAEALIEARLAPAPEAAADWLDDGGGSQLVVARELPAEGGGSRARIDGRLAPIGALDDVLGPDVEIHTQHEHLRLSKPAVQRDLLDRYAGPEHTEALDAYRATYRRWREATDSLEELRSAARERARELDRLEDEIEEIDAAGLDQETDGRLDEELARLEHAAQLRQTAAEAAAALGGDGAGEPLGVAVSALRSPPVDDPELAALTERAVSLAEEARDLAGEVRAWGESLEVDSRRLNELQERRQLVRDLQRKYGDDVQAVLDYAEEARERAGRLRRAEEESTELEERIAELDDRLVEQAAAIRRGRRRAGEQLAAVVNEHLADLAMPHASVTVEVTGGERGPHGADRVAFLLAANPGEPPVPLGGGASGGERSRVALAVEVALADVNDAPILVFDEVDAGVGGATALAVGEKLARLAGSTGGGPGGDRQVLCVTHLAQLAAFADTHFVIEKEVEDGRTVTTVRRVADEARAHELARMLGGGVAPDAGVAHARELLEEAGERARAGVGDG